MIPVFVLFVVFLITAISHPQLLRRGDGNDDVLTRERAHGLYHGIDVSHYQGKIDWDIVGKNPNIQFVYIKATEGSTHTDPLFRTNLEGARGAGMNVGAYHFLTSSSPIATQFAHYWTVTDSTSQTLLPMIDVEWVGVKGWTREQLQDSLAAFVKLVKSFYGRTPLIYSDLKFYQKMLSPRFDSLPLFIAHYHDQEPVVTQAHHYYIWQRDEHGHIDGIEKEVDLDAFVKGTTLDDIMK